MQSTIVAATTVSDFSHDDTATSTDNGILRLVDVDCNLWHSDLEQLWRPLCDSTSTNNTTKDTLSIIPDCFRILQHDDVRNIVAVVSPSSTVAQAERGISALSDLETALKSDNGANSSTHSDRRDATVSPLVQFPRILTTIGIHPYHVTDEDIVEQGLEAHMQRARRLLMGDQALTNETKSIASIENSHGRRRRARWCSAIGECGLDASDGFPPLDQQIPVFVAQLQWAIELHGTYPLFVHERLAFDTTMALLQQHIAHNEHGPCVPILIHCFTGTVAECRAYVERGYFLSISGHVFRDSAHEVRQCLVDGVLPLDKLMVETDAPYMGFASCRDALVAHNADFMQSLKAKERKKWTGNQRPNPPSALTAVLLKVLDLINQGRVVRGERLLTARELAHCTSRNANEFFGFGFSNNELWV
jgi:TatD DNase family protein